MKCFKEASLKQYLAVEDVLYLLGRQAEIIGARVFILFLMRKMHMLQMEMHFGVDMVDLVIP